MLLTESKTQGPSDEERARIYASKCEPANQGARNTALNLFVFAIAERFALAYETIERLGLEFAGRFSPPYPSGADKPSEVEDTIRSAYLGCKRAGKLGSKRTEEFVHGGGGRPAPSPPGAGQAGDPASKAPPPPARFASQAVAERIEDIIAGRFKAVDLPWPGISRLTQALLPGTITVLCAPPGASKSLMMLDLILKLVMSGEKTAIMEMEEDATFHNSRVLAQVAGNSMLLHPEWVRANPDKARAAAVEHASILDEVGRCIYEAPLDITGANIASWTRTQVAEGKRVVIIDPISAKQTAGTQVWKDDQDTLLAMRTALKGQNCSIVLITHPNGETDNRKLIADPLADFSGGKCWSRFTQTCMFLRPLEPQNATIKNKMGTSTQTINRRMEIRKTRNGGGAGLWIGMWFDHETLQTRELGVIQK